MRLEAIARGRGLKARSMFAMIRLMSGAQPVDVVKTLSFRPSFFGDPFDQLIQEVMRGPSEWTVSERELFRRLRLRAQPLRVLNGCPRRGRVEELREDGDGRRPS